MTTREIREAFLSYFERQGHLRLPSAPLVPYEDDPSVLLTIAGMQPLKSYFLGAGDPPARRMTSCQKCFRTNDIDQVGHTARHLTFFEMLGNFSIGDYFKADAIRFGWELSTEVFGLDPELIWITVFEGTEGVPADEEAVELWVETGVPRERIQAFGDPENFWSAGPTGPCGPNTELFLDRGPAFGPEGGPAVGGDRYLEYWNLVFMQYDRGADGSLTPLPSKNIDTGAGLERLAAILQDVPSVFDTDAFRPLVSWAEGASGRRYGADPRADRALRVLADHGRAMTFLAADGVRPSNEGRGYILRRIVRRAVSEATQIGLEPEAVVALAGPVVDGWGDAYPELRQRAAEVRDVIGAEAEQFARTLTQGRRLLGEVIERSRAPGTVSGDDAFRLHDTYGYPLDLTVEAAQDAGLGVDAEAFERLMDDQRERSRAAAGPLDATGDLAERAAAVGREAAPAEFVGWEAMEVDTRVTAMEELGDGTALLKLERSPFYPEGGGQVSDSGEIAGSLGRATVVGAVRLGDDQVLRVRLDEGHLPVGAEVTARVQRRPAAPDPGQPHRDPRPQLGPARDARLRRAPGRLLRRAGQAALRLHPPRPRAARGARAHRGDGQRAGRGGPARDLGDHGPRRGRPAGRDRTLRGEVRRARAGPVDGRLLQGAVRRHPRREHRRDRPLRDHRRGVRPARARGGSRP